MITQELVGELRKSSIDFEVVPHEHTEHATDEAAALGISQQEVGKTLILKGSGGFVRAVLPASERLDLRSVRERLGDRDLRLATEEELASAYAGFELGAVPPFGGRDGDRVVVDRRIAELDRVVFEAGTHEESLRIGAADLVALTGADVLDLCRAD
jgi:Ala-tRNA(Pro) deacylase